MSKLRARINSLWRDFCDADIRFFFAPTGTWHRAKGGDRVYVNGAWVLIQCEYDFKWIIDEDASYCEQDDLYIWGKIFEENLSQITNGPFYTKYYNMILRTYKGTATDPPVDLTDPHPGTRQNISVTYRIDGHPELDNVFNVSLSNEQSKIFAAPNTSANNPFYPKQITEYNNPVLQLQYMFFSGKSRGDWTLIQTIANAGFSGFRINPLLKKVTNDGNNFPLDINNQLASLTGLPQDTMQNPIGSQTYRVEDAECSDEISSFFSAAISENFEKDCAPTEESIPISYSLPEGAYSSIIDQVDADGKAIADVNTNGPIVAQENAQCIPDEVGNDLKTQSFTRNNCASGFVGSQVVYTVEANTFFAATKEQANLLAQNNIDANGQTYANNNGTCTIGNDLKTQSFTRNNCASGFVGSQVIYTVEADTYFAATKEQANLLAQNNIDSNGQTYANNNGTCSTGNDLISQDFTRNNCGLGFSGSVVSYSIPANTFYAPTKIEANQLAQNQVDANGQEYANANGTCTQNQSVPVNYTIEYGRDPYTQTGLLFFKNDDPNEVARIQFQGSGVLTDIYHRGDKIRIIEFSYPENFPWTTISQAAMKAMEDAIVKFDEYVNDQVTELQTTEWIIGSAANAINVSSIGSSVAENYLTHTLTCDNSFALDDITVKITDPTGAPGLTPQLAINVNPKTGNSAFDFNVFNDGVPLDVIVTNNTAGNMDITITGISGFLYSVTLAAGQTCPVQHPPKGSVSIQTILTVVE